MVAQHAGGAGGFHEIMRFDTSRRVPAADGRRAHRVCGYGGGFAIDGQSHGFARAYARCERRGERQRDHACRHWNTPKRHESPGVHLLVIRPLSSDCLHRRHCNGQIGTNGMVSAGFIYTATFSRKE